MINIKHNSLVILLFLLSYDSLSAGGRVMETYTTQPGIQFYTGYFLKGGVGKPCTSGETFCGKGGAKYEQYSGLCLETQNYPDAPNKVIF